MALITVGALWSQVDARWVIGDRKPASQIHAGDTVVIEQSSRATFRDYYIQATTDHNGVSVLQGTGADNAAIIVLEEGPKDVRTGANTVYMKLLSTGRYIGTGTNWGNGVGTASDPANAANFQILDCGVDIPWSNTYSWDDYVAGTLREGMSGDEVSNWRTNTNEGGRGSDAQSVGFSYSSSESDFYYLAYWYATAPVAMLWGYTDTNQWNVYSATYEKTLQDDLADLINVYTADGATEFIAGTDPGYYDAEKVEAYNNALEQGLVISATPNLSDEEYQTAIDNLKNTHNDVVLAQIPITEGYYFMVSAYADYLNNFGIEKAAYINASTQKLAYRTLDVNNADFAFHITKATDENDYYMQSYVTGQYIGSSSVWYNSAPSITVDPETPQTIRSRYTGMWYINSKPYPRTSYTPFGTSSPTAADNEGNLTTWGQWTDNPFTEVYHANLWYLRRVSDGKIDSFAVQKAQSERDSELRSLTEEANDLYKKLFVYTTDYNTPLITTVSGGADETPGSDNQITFARISRQGIDGADKYEYLIDGDTTTYMQGRGYIAIKLTEPRQYVTFVYNKRGATAERPNAGTWGQNERPNRVRIYGANTLEGDTVYGQPVDDNVYMGSLPLPATYSTNLTRPVNRIAYEVLTNQNGGNYFTLSEFQIYAAAPDETNSQYYSVEGMKAVADQMKQLATTKLAIADSALTTAEDIQQMSQAIQAVRALYSDTTTLLNLITEAQSLAATTVGEDIGQVNSAEAVTTLQAAIASAREQGLKANVTKTELDAAIASLTAAIKAFTDQINTFEEGKWYYILNADLTEESRNAGKALYMSGYADDSQAKVGKVTNGNAEYTYDPNSMWRFVKADSVNYYIQNMGTGFYLPAGGTANSNVLQSYKGVPYKISFAGNGTFSFTPQQTNSHSYVITAKGENAVYMEAGSADSTTWNLLYVDPEETQYIMLTNFKNNAMDIFAVPFNVSQIADLNEDAHLYGIRKMSRDTTTDITTIEFYEKEEVAANEPAFFVFGNTENETEDFELLLPFPTEVVDSLIPENGLYGMLKPEHIEPGIAYSSNKGLILAGSDGAGISAHTGAINPKYYTGEVRGQETAFTLQIQGLVWPDTPVEPTNKADVNNDGEINSADIAVVYNFIANGEQSGYTKDAVDVNGDGDVNSSDVATIYAQIAGTDGAASKAFVKRILNMLLK